MPGVEKPRRVLRLAAVAVAALLAGTLSGTGGRAVGDGKGVSVLYDCGFPSAAQRVTVRLVQDYPASGAVGLPVRPGALDAVVVVPRAAASQLPLAAGGTVGGTGELTAHVTEGTSAADARWSALTVAPTALPATGDLQLPLNGAVTPVSVTVGGSVTFTAGALVLVLAAQPLIAGTASPAPGGSAAPAVPPTRISCSVTPGQNARLGVVPVIGVPSASPSTPVSASASASGSASAKPTPSGPTPSGRPSAGPTPPARLLAPPRSTIRVGAAAPVPVTSCPDPPVGKVDPSLLAPTLPPDIIDYAFNPPTGLCAYVVGLSLVRKLGEAMIVNDPGRTPKVTPIGIHDLMYSPNTQFSELIALGRLDLPDSDSTFLTFGFMPTSARVHFTSLTDLSIVAIQADLFSPTYTTIAYDMDLRIYDVKVNGTPLDVGTHCGTAHRIHVVLHGTDSNGYNVYVGGPLTGEITIPPFSGCGSHGEDLDPLFTASLSGPGNTLSFVQGGDCYAAPCDGLTIPPLPTAAPATP